MAVSAEKEPGIPCPRCGFNENDEQPYLALPLGTILNGRYLVGKVLGIGGFGITYLGYDLTLEIKVAIKEYMPPPWPQGIRTTIVWR